ncbi:hypothetical protein [Lyngbya confervoides]|uniref:Uncharacterized protein n=1 Tax=Lyngbya confervoides BDU141951 TaxID=1574623 RepID=A0ABD4T5V0_9CYAN|nr:hypothetical protein [Lyngbya confervoides]MCM1983816.1 hypothetical protein [Lyngbya confervoides BDU141951]
MIKSPEIPLMTKYWIRKILIKYEDRINQKQLGKPEINAKKIQIDQLLERLHYKPEDQLICAKQLESLVNTYQVYCKQKLPRESEKIELKILYVLGYTDQD